MTPDRIGRAQPLAHQAERLDDVCVASRAASAADHPGGASRHPLVRLHAFFAERIWSVRLGELRRGQALLYRASRIAYATVHGFLVNRLTVRGAALTYYTVLSIVPFLAFAFAIVKGFGAYSSLIEGTVRPYLRTTFGDNAALLGSIEWILRFVDRTGVSTLGAVGLLVLVYTSVSLLASVEDALNEIWAARTRRSLLRQVTDYVTLLVTTPLLVVAAATAATAAQSSQVVVFLRDALGLGGIIDFFLRFTSLAVVGIAFFAIYMILPNARIRPLSAAIGAGGAALLWQGALVLYVRLQVGVSSYNALYSVLGALPIFLVWTYVSWLVVLIGAQVAASHQNVRAVGQRFRAEHTDQALRETLAVVVGAHVAHDFLTGARSRSPVALADLLAVSPFTIEEILHTLVDAGVLAEASAGGETRWLPARDLDAMRVQDLRDALRRDPRAQGIHADLERHLAPEIRTILGAAEEESRGSAQNVTLRQLAAMLGDHDAAQPGPAQPPPIEELPDARPVKDAK